MINKKITNSIIIFLLLFSTLNTNASINIEIIFKINNQIVTNIDLENEKKFLLFLNPNLKSLSNEQIENISLDSLKNRKIKEIELNKFTDLGKENLGTAYINNYIGNSQLVDKDDLINKIKQINLEYKYFEKNFIIDNVWREYIFSKFKSQIKIDIESLKSNIQNKETEVEELNISEILFETEPNKSVKDLTKEIYEEIDKSGFEVAASIYSISDSKNFGGKLGWIRSNQLSKEVYSEIAKGNKISSPIQINNNYLIIKVNEKRLITQEIDYKKELQKLINLETERELNKLGYIYFNKIKKRIFISEN